MHRKHKEPPPLKHALSLGLVLFVLWGLLSGHTEGWLLALGLASCALVVFIGWRMDVVDHEGHPIHLSWRVLQYWPWLFWEIVKANWDVTKAILKPRMNISPTVIHIDGGQKSEIGDVIYGNSITLTPGTVTIQLENGQLTVHALNREAAEALLTGDMGRRVYAIETDEEDGNS